MQNNYRWSPDAKQTSPQFHKSTIPVVFWSVLFWPDLFWPDLFWPALFCSEKKHLYRKNKVALACDASLDKRKHLRLIHVIYENDGIGAGNFCVSTKNQLSSRERSVKTLSKNPFPCMTFSDLENCEWNIGPLKVKRPFQNHIYSTVANQWCRLPSEKIVGFVVAKLLLNPIY